MCQTAAFAAASHFRRLAAVRRHWHAAAIGDRPRRPWIAASTLLVITTALKASVAPTGAATAQVETSSLRSPVLPLCPAGTHLNYTSMIECHPCISGVSFTATANRKQDCFECLRCPGLIIESSCNATHNTVCRCPPGQYLNVDGGCTILAPIFQNGAASSATSSNAMDAAVNVDKLGRSYEQEFPSAELNTALLLITAVGVIALIIMTVIFYKVNGNCCKWRSKPSRKLSRSNAEKTNSVQLDDHPNAVTVSDLSRGTQTDEPRPVKPKCTQTEEPRSTRPNGSQTDEPRTTQANGTQTDEHCNTQLNIQLCAEIEDKANKKVAEYTHKGETLDVNEQQLASHKLARADETAALAQLRHNVPSDLEQDKAAVVVLQHDKRAASIQVTENRADTHRESGGDSGRQVTENLSRLTEAHHDGPSIAEPEISRVTASVESLKNKIRRITEQSDASDVARVILIELEAFIQNPYGYFQTSPTN